MELIVVLLSLVAGIFAYTLALYAASELILINSNGGFVKALVQGIEITIMRVLFSIIPFGAILTFLIILSQIKVVYRTNNLYAFLIAVIASLLYEGLIYLMLIPF